MRKGLLFIILSAIFCIGWSIDKTPGQVRIYINPGHGGWGVDDRPMNTIPHPNTVRDRRDTLGFYESNTDLWKCLGLYEALKRMGVQGSNLRMSRWSSGPYPDDGRRYDDTVSKHTWLIAAEAEQFKPDLFVSVHSDASRRSYRDPEENHMLMLYRGRDTVGGDEVPGSRAAAYAIWPRHYMDEIDHITDCSRTQTNIRGDFDFYHVTSTRTNQFSGVSYKGYLGVLKHGYPGVLIEGFTHTYGPETHRALNPDYCAQEGVRIARGICDYLHLRPERTGYIMGTVKDGERALDLPNSNLYVYAKGSVDTYKPINGAVVELYQGDTKLQSYKTDQNYNGVFVFQGLKPAANYYLHVTAGGYKSVTTGPYAVTANETTYPQVLVYRGQGDGNLKRATQPMKLTPAYTDALIPDLEGLTVRRMLLRGNDLIVLAVDTTGTPSLMAINIDAPAAVRHLSVAGLDSTATLPLSDITLTSDGKLIGCNQVELGGDSRDSLRIYIWDTPHAQPRLWLKSSNTGGWNRCTAGRSLTCNGSSHKGKLVVSYDDAHTYKVGRTHRKSLMQINLVAMDVTGDSIDASSATCYVHDPDTLLNASNMGLDYRLTLSPIDRNSVIIDGRRTTPVEAQLDQPSRSLEVLGRIADSNVAGQQGAIVPNQNGVRLLIGPYSIDNTSNVGVSIYDVEYGLNSAYKYTSDAPGMKPYRAQFAGVQASSDPQGRITVVLLRDHLLSKFTTR